MRAAPTKAGALVAGWVIAMRARRIIRARSSLGGLASRQLTRVSTISPPPPKKKTKQIPSCTPPPLAQCD